MSVTQNGSNSGPGYVKQKAHTLTLEPVPQRIRVIINGETVADTKRALELTESNCPPRYYFPRTDVRNVGLTTSATDTYCPFKGTASYWAFTVGDRVAEDAAWSYEEPYDEMLSIKGYFCFYDERVDEVIVGDSN